jgi:hypothetical protein
MPHVLGVTTLELCHPLVLVILMIPNDPTFGGHSTKMERFVSQVNAVPSIQNNSAHLPESCMCLQLYSFAHFQ